MYIYFKSVSLQLCCTCDREGEMNEFNSTSFVSGQNGLVVFHVKRDQMNSISQ